MMKSASYLATPFVRRRSSIYPLNEKLYGNPIPVAPVLNKLDAIDPVTTFVDPKKVPLKHSFQSFPALTAAM